MVRSLVIGNQGGPEITVPRVQEIAEVLSRDREISSVVIKVAWSLYQRWSNSARRGKHELAQAARSFRGHGSPLEARLDRDEGQEEVRVDPILHGGSFDLRSQRVSAGGVLPERPEALQELIGDRIGASVEELILARDIRGRSKHFRLADGGY
jgi:hypothetical protein